MTLSERVDAFDLMKLPGQPKIMHLGTYRLIHDLWKLAQERNRLLVLATKHCPESHPDWQEISELYMERSLK